MKKVTIEVPENMENVINDFLSWEPAQMKTDFSNLIYYFGLMGINADVTEKLDYTIAFTPIELQNLIIKLKNITDSLD